MFLMNLMRGWPLMIAIWLLGPVKPTATFSSKINADIPPVNRDAGSEAFIEKILQSSENSREDILVQALDLISSHASSPSCTRLATFTLLKSCQTLDGSTDIGQELENREEYLDKVKSIYAARLAVCELVGAGAPVPAQCSPIMPSPLKEKYGAKGFLSRNGLLKDEKPEAEGYDNISRRQLGHCLRSLESKPQSWTSYSNGRQNAFAICRAVRTEIEKDELLALHKEMSGVTSILSSTLSRVLDESGARLAGQRNFSEALQRLQTRVLRDLEDTESTAQGFFDKIKQDVNSILQTVVGKILIAGRTAETSVNILSQHALRELVARVSLEHIAMGELMSKLGKGLDVLDESQSRLHEGMNASINALRGSILGATADVVLVKSIANETHAKLKEIGIFFHLGGIVMSRWGWLVVMLTGAAMAGRRATGFIAIGA
ncbi:hypothetical protein GP486_004343, partial [Trichoglossum hirsutum]